MKSATARRVSAAPAANIGIAVPIPLMHGRKKLRIIVSLVLLQKPENVKLARARKRQNTFAGPAAGCWEITKGTAVFAPLLVNRPKNPENVLFRDGVVPAYKRLQFPAIIPLGNGKFHGVNALLNVQTEKQPKTDLHVKFATTDVGVIRHARQQVAALAVAAVVAAPMSKW